MKLYIYEHCPFCTRARMIFGLKAIPVELEVIMEGDSETPISLIGKKAVPILRKDDGSHMGESLDIVRYVNALGKPMLTAPADDGLDRWGTNVWPTALKLFIPRFTKGDFVELATPEAREAYRLREEKAFGNLAALMDQTTELTAEIDRQLEVLAPLVDGRDDVGISDIKLWPILRSLSIVDGLSFPGPVLDYMRQLEVRGGVGLLFNQKQ